MYKDVIYKLLISNIARMGHAFMCKTVVVDDSKFFSTRVLKTMSVLCDESIIVWPHLFTKSNFCFYFVMAK